MRKLFWVLVGGLLLVTPAAAQDTPPFEPVEQMTVDVLAEFPHATDAFTQGLLYDGGLLYESTGRYGESTLRAVEPETGEVLRRFALPDEVFAEGLALLEGRLFQLTWREQVAFVYEQDTAAEDDTFEPLGLFQYSGEGWGLCSDGEQLYMSDGSNTITVRNPETFETVRTFRVTLYGAFVDQLNELECTPDGALWSNVWQSDTILRIDPESGAVTGVVDASGLLDAGVRAGLESGAVLNGIAYNPDEDVFYITGKLWPSLFEVRFAPAAE